ncbi:hypothetical protein [Halothiobacillus sp.]|uniref:DinB/UmuC family translesion DNA polymerase n=1 Tax=Halothiobacillus sp. TaxID=1891311 RepID=UPI00345C1F39
MIASVDVQTTEPPHRIRGILPILESTTRSRATDDTRVLVKHVIQGLERIYQPGHDYQKAGVMLLDIRPKGQGPRTDNGSVCERGSRGFV